MSGVFMARAVQRLHQEGTAVSPSFRFVMLYLRDVMFVVDLVGRETVRRAEADRAFEEVKLREPWRQRSWLSVQRARRLARDNPSVGNQLSWNPPQDKNVRTQRRCRLIQSLRLR